MSPETHSQMANFIWSICNLLRGPYKRNEYRKVILPLTVIRRFDCILEPTKKEVLNEFDKLKGKSENIIRSRLTHVTGSRFYNTSKLDFQKLLDDPNSLATNLNSYLHAFSPNVRQIMERFSFSDHIERLNEKNLLYEVIKSFAAIDLSPGRIDNLQMGYIFEELIRVGAEQANEEAGEHFTPREIIHLMVELLLTNEDDLGEPHVVKKIFDPACGTGGMLSMAEQYIRELNKDAQPYLYGQDWNDEAFAICKSDMLLKGENAENIKPGDSFSDDGFKEETFDYMMANPPFGVEWKQQKQFIEKEHKTMGHDGRFGAGLPRINDGALLFLQHMISKMENPKKGGSRIGIVFNGSPLFTGDAGSGESEIRRWIIENDWLEGIVALPEQMFYNTGISTYIWILSNRKPRHRKGKVQLVDARQFWVPMRKSLGHKRRQIGEGKDGRPDQIGLISKIYGEFIHDDTRTVPVNGGEKEMVVSKMFDNEDFGYHKITVERPLRLNFQASSERIARIEEEKAFVNLANSKKTSEKARQKEIEAGQKRQQAIREVLEALRQQTGEEQFKDREAFLDVLKKIERQMSGDTLTATERKAVLSALSERDETAEICRNSKGEPEPDPELRDTEVVPLKENIEDYFELEVLPHVPDAWIDHDKTRVGYEIPLTRHFYRYEPPRPLEEIQEDLAELEKDIVRMLKEVVA